jgi:hypothetical protein
VTTPDKNTDRASQLTSDLVIASFLGDIEIDGFGNLTKLDPASLKSEQADAKAQRFELINHAKAGKHLELAVTAQTYAQTKKPNRRYLRLGEDQLEARAPTWKGQPYLVDHNTWSMKSAMGTITSSKAVAIDGGTGFEQKLHAVKSDAVIGILDGTFNKFSIGWWPDGPILCSVHGTDIMKLDGCNCWPGDKVKLDDGRERIVEFIFTSFRGKETSSVVIPAVQDTHIDEVRAALAAELQIQRPHRTIVATTKENAMLFHRLAVALGLTALSEADEDRALAAVSALQARANTADSLQTRLTQAEGAVKTLTAAAVGAQVDTQLRHDGYAAGKLRYGRDDAGRATASPLDKWLRELGASAGIDVMKAQLAQMPVIVPVGQRLQAATVTEAERTELGSIEDDVSVDNPYLKNAAALTGQKVEDLVAFSKGHIAQEGR